MEAYTPAESVAVNEDDTTENVSVLAQQVAEGTDAVKPVQVMHGLEHLKSRAVLAITAWNSNIGSRSKVQVLTTKFMENAWSGIVDRISDDITIDAGNLNEVKWLPIGYFLQQAYTAGIENPKQFNNKVFAALLTSGEYVYLEVKDNNFYPAGNTEASTIPANKVIMLRETGVVKGPVEQTITADDSEYVRTLSPQAGVVKPRYGIKEANSERAWNNAIAKRRKANKSAKQQRKIRK